MTNLSGANLNSRDAGGPKGKGRESPSSFPKYPEYKDSGVDWLGRVPVHWDVVPTRAFVEERNGKNIDGEDQNYLSLMANRGIIPYAEKGDVGNKKPDDLARCKIVRKGDLVLNSMNYGIGSYGISHLNGVCSPVYIILEPRLNRVSARYVLRIFENKEFQKLAQSFGQGILAHRSSISWEDLKNMKIPLPPIDEQDLLGKFLDHETAKIDALIDEQKRLIELLKEKRQAVISHAVTKGLDPNTSMKDSGVEWLGEVPAHWDVGPLRWYATIQGGIAKGKSYSSDEDVVERPYLRVANVQDGHVDLSDVRSIIVAASEVQRYSLRDGDVLMNEGGDNDKLGRGTVWKGQVEGCLHQNHVFAIRPDTRLSAEWIAAFTRSDSARTYFYLYSKQSTNLASISSSNVMSCPVPIPPIREQEAILKTVSTALSKIDGLIHTARSTMTLLDERRSALISAAVTGKIDVRDWQPLATGTQTYETTREGATA